MRIGAATALHFKGKTGVMADDRRLVNVKNAIVAGIEKTNEAACDMGMGFGALLSFSIREKGLDGGIMLTLKDGICYLYFYDRFGLKVSFDGYSELKRMHSQLPDGALAVNISSGRESRCDVTNYINSLKTTSVCAKDIYLI